MGQLARTGRRHAAASRIENMNEHFKKILTEIPRCKRGKKREMCTTVTTGQDGNTELPVEERQ